MPHKLALHGFLVSLVVGAAFFAIVITVSGEGSGTFTLTSGDMSTGRSTHTATRLSDGRVLIAGGCCPYTKDVKLYEPSLGIFTGGSSMSVPRGSHTATLLSGDRVLVAGGINDGLHLKSAEVYDSSTDEWTATGNMGTARREHTATRLPDGRVLIAGGFNGSPISSVEIYYPDPDGNPATVDGTFISGDAMSTARYGHKAVLLPDGKVLVVGGFDSDYLKSAEVYDPSTGKWTMTGSMATRRYNHTLTSLSDMGQVLVIGGFNHDGFRDSAEVFEDGAWSYTTSSLITARRRHEATLLSDGMVLVAGGENGNVQPTPHGTLASAELYDPDTGTFSLIGSMNIPRSFHTTTLLLDGTVLVAGGFDGSSAQGTYLASAELYEPGPLLVEIDFKPGSDPNCFNNNGKGVIPVAVLGNSEFDVTTVDASTLRLAGCG